MADPDCTDGSDTDESSPSPTGLTNVTGCAIQEGDATCDILVTWNQPTGDPEVTVTDATPGSVAGNSDTEAFAGGPGDHTVTLRDRTSGVTYDTEVVTISCAVNLGWDTVSGTCVAAPTINTFEVCTVAFPLFCTDGTTPLDVPVGSEVTVTWDVTPGATCSVLDTPIPGLSGGGANGNVTVTASAPSQNYHIACSIGTGPVTQSNPIVVTTSGGGGVNPTLTIRNTDGDSVHVVDMGEPITLEWNTGGTTLETACTLSGGGRSSADLMNGSGDSYTGTSDTFTVTGRTIFRMNCGGLTTSFTLEVIPREWNS